MRDSFPNQPLLPRPCLLLLLLVLVHETLLFTFPFIYPHLLSSLFGGEVRSEGFIDLLPFSSLLLSSPSSSKFHSSLYFLLVDVLVVEAVDSLIGNRRTLLDLPPDPLASAPAERGLPDV